MHYNGKAIIMYHHRTVVYSMGRVMSCHAMSCKVVVVVVVGWTSQCRGTERKKGQEERCVCV